MRQLLLTAILMANTTANSENLCEIAIDSDYYHDYYMNYEKPNEQEEVCRVAESNYHLINDKYWAKLSLAQYDYEDCCFKVSLEIDGKSSVLCPKQDKSDLKLYRDGNSKHFDLYVLNGVGKIITIIDKNNVKLIHPIAGFHEERPSIHRDFENQLSIAVNNDMRTCLMYNQKFKNITDPSEIISCQVKLINDSKYVNGSGFLNLYDKNDNFWIFSMDNNIDKIYQCNCTYHDCDFNYMFIKDKKIPPVSSAPQNASLAQASTITMSVVGILLMIIVSGYCVRMIKNRKNFIGNSHAKIDMESILPLQVNNFLYDICTGEGELSEITKLNKSQIKVGKLIGSGRFGEVFEGVLAVSHSDILVQAQKVAIKHMINNENSVEFLKEAMAWSQLKHENIVSFLGICLESDFLLSELMEGGQLLQYLKSNTQNLSMWDLVQMMEDIVKGCSYLEKMKFVHRDLAARNCLLTSTNDKLRKVKIGDFGLARDINKNDYYRGGGNLPINWMAPESLMEGIFSTQSDVWGFGILIWEILTLGRRPYQEFSHDQVKHFVCKLDGHPAVPPLCPPLLADHLLQCWSFDPKGRPSFESLLHCIEDLEMSKTELQGRKCCQYSPSWIKNPRSRRSTKSSQRSHQLSGESTDTMITTTNEITSLDNVFIRMESCPEEDNQDIDNKQMYNST